MHRSSVSSDFTPCIVAWGGGKRGKDGSNLKGGKKEIIPGSAQHPCTQHRVCMRVQRWLCMQHQAQCRAHAPPCGSSQAQPCCMHHIPATGCSNTTAPPHSRATAASGGPFSLPTPLSLPLFSVLYLFPPWHSSGWGLDVAVNIKGAALLLFSLFFFFLKTVNIDRALFC